MALATLLQIIAAAVLTVFSSSTIKALRRRNEEHKFLSANGEIHQRRHANESALFEFDKQQRDWLLGIDDTSIDSSFESKIESIRETFDREGYVIVRGLLSDDTVENLDSAGTEYVHQIEKSQETSFAAFKFAPVFLSPPSSDGSREEEEDQSKLKAFREASMESAIPHFVAETLLDMEPTQSLRILKDVFLVKGEEADYCGWHVDDILFWPTSAHATSDVPGVNAWIAMDDIPASRGGGLAVSPRSHRAEWKQDAYEAIGSTRLFPEEGHETWEDAFAYNGSTCAMAKTAPEMASFIDSHMEVFDFQKGDVLLHTRWLFHRSVPLTEEGKKYFTEIEETPLIRRYSIRYEVGDAQLMNPTMEPSVVLNPENQRKSLDDVSQSDLAWYPKCWPEVDSKEVAQMHEIVKERLPAYETEMVELRKKILPLIVAKKNA